jgi:two-component system, OmpR family, copper resistance phosphate regulon response regulator CusR
MKILVIEDDMSVRNVLRLSLETKGFIVDEAEDGELGSYLARTNSYDVILLDNVLPKKMGGHVCKEIRDAGIFTPILMLSSKQEVLTKVTLLDSGVDDYVTKPFSFEELLARLRAIIRRPKEIKTSKIKFKDFEINFINQTIKKNGKEIYLTRKEFALLEFLSQKQNQVVSRGQILEHVWDMSIDPFSNTIETHIMNLRKKLKDVRRKIITSIPGRGYKFNLNQE